WYQLTLVRNTFSDISQFALWLEGPPAAGDTSSKLTVTRNFFNRTTTIMGVKEGSWPPAALNVLNNGRHAAAGEGNIPTGSLPANQELPPPDPANDAPFLRPPKGGELHNLTVGAPPA